MSSNRWGGTACAAGRCMFPPFSLRMWFWGGRPSIRTCPAPLSRAAASALRCPMIPGRYVTEKERVGGHSHSDWSPVLSSTPGAPHKRLPAISRIFPGIRPERKDGPRRRRVRPEPGPETRARGARERPSNTDTMLLNLRRDTSRSACPSSPKLTEIGPHFAEFGPNLVVARPLLVEFGQFRVTPEGTRFSVPPRCRGSHVNGTVGGHA